MMALPLAGTMPAATPSTLPSEAFYRAGVPKGTITDYVWDQSKVFPGTWRQYWVYVPAQYDPDREAAVMVFQDGARFMDPKGHFRVPAVFDNLIHQVTYR